MYEIEQRDLTEQPAVVMRATLDVAEIGPFIGQAYGRIAAYIGEAGGAIAGPPFARYGRQGDTMTFSVEAGFPVGAPLPGTGDIEMLTLPGGPAAVTVHIGPYDAMEPAYEAVMAWVAERGTPSDLPREVYFSDPEQQPDPATWRTEVIQPFRPS